MKKLLILFTLFTLLSSHEFWLNPDKFIYDRGAKINVRFLVGENFEGENWNGNQSRIQSLKLYYGGVNDDLSKYISDENGDSIELSMLDEGTPMIAFNSNNSFIELEAAKFNEYLAEDGLQEAIEYRNQHNETDSIGREMYQRCAKTIFQVGKIKDNTYKTATLLPVDIIPLNNPYTLKDNDSIRVKILFLQQPLSYTLIKIWQRGNNSTTKEELTTNENGEITFPVSVSGKWMVSVVKMIRLPDDAKADPIAIGWQSYWGSLTWGYE